MPWVESPFFHKLIEKLDIPKYKVELAKEFNAKGYVIIQLGLTKTFIEDLINEINSLSTSKDVKTNSTFFSYNNSPRIVDAGKHSTRVVNLALHEEVLSLLRFFYRKEPIPFSTINFIKGTEQPLHSDTIHFGTIPKGYLSAAWVALEDTDKDNGALRVIEGSHKLKDIDFFDLKLTPPKNSKQAEDIYKQYEHYVQELVLALNLKERTIFMEKGSVLIWAANLLHGGGIITDQKRTRYSQVTHYNFEDCDYNFYPFFSSPINGKYISRNLNELDIRKLKRNS